MIHDWKKESCKYCHFRVGDICREAPQTKRVRAIHVPQGAILNEREGQAYYRYLPACGRYTFEDKPKKETPDSDNQG